MTTERLWSPQMRKWIRDAERHGLQIAWEKMPRSVRWEGGGRSVPTPPAPPVATALFPVHFQIIDSQAFFFIF